MPLICFKSISFVRDYITYICIYIYAGSSSSLLSWDVICWGRLGSLPLGQAIAKTPFCFATWSVESAEVAASWKSILTALDFSTSFRKYWGQHNTSLDMQPERRCFFDGIAEKPWGTCHQWIHYGSTGQWPFHWHCPPRFDTWSKMYGEGGHEVLKEGDVIIHADILHRIVSGWWWLEHEFYFALYGRILPNWRTHIFQRGRSTTNQID